MSSALKYVRWKKLSIYLVLYGGFALAWTLAMRDHPEWSWFSVYATTVLWCGMVLWAYRECWLEFAADAKELERVSSLKLLLLVGVAKIRLKRAAYFLKMVHARALIGAMAAYVLYLVPPVPDASPLQSLLRIVFIVELYWFVMAKRTDRGARRMAREGRLSSGRSGDVS